MSSTGKNNNDVSTLKRALVAVKELNAKLASVEQAKKQPIAIIGAACRLPGGVNSLEDYWDLLRNGREAIVEVPKDRWDIDEYYDPDPEKPGKMYTRHGGFLDNIDQFDPRFFGIAPREANSMDPQQRLLLETSWEALERAGIAPNSLNGSKTGVFVGISTNDFSHLLMGIGDENIDPYSGTGGAFCVASGRLSYVLGLQGPNFAIDTACSSSLVAVHEACQSLRAGKSEMAIAGGVNLIIRPEPNIYFTRMKAISPDGRCKTFDAAADGYGRGEGCGVIILKRLSDALKDKDNILALIRGSAINHDGKSSGLTVPSGPAQQKVIRAALEDGGLQASQISFLEAHGTGTPLGDPIELRSAHAALGQDREEKLLVGSAKTNFGHLEAAAGITGLLKIVLALQNKQIPPHLNFSEPSPQIDWDDLNVAVTTELQDWNPPSRERLAGVSSFGFSGTNAHVILGEASSTEDGGWKTEEKSRVKRSVQILALSVQNDAALNELAFRYIQKLSAKNAIAHSPSPIADICFTANTGRAHFANRLALTGDSIQQLRAKLDAFLEGKPAQGLANGAFDEAQRPRVAFLYTGQGAQYAGMGKTLYETEPVFRAALDRCDEILQEHLDESILDIIFYESVPQKVVPVPNKSGRIENEHRPLDSRLRGNDDPERPVPENAIDQTAYTQPALFAVEYALSELWRSWGVEPGVVMGHSVGEYVAATVAGVTSLEDGLKLIAARGRLMQSLPQNGAMAAVFAEEKNVAETIAPFSEKVSIAAANGPENIVISGEKTAIEEILQKLETAGVKHKKLTVSHAFHSPLMEPILDEFERAAEEIEFKTPRVPLISNVTGEPIKKFDAKYWREHIRQAVRFSDSIEHIHGQGYSTFLEIGPNPTLSGMGARCLPDSECAWIPSLRQGKDDNEQILANLGALYTKGIEIDWSGFHKNFEGRKIVLPTYPFQRKRYWLEDDKLKRRTNFAANSSEGAQELFYDIVWREVASPKIEPDRVSPQEGSWLIFADRGGAGETLAELLKEKGQDSVKVFSGEKYREIDDGNYEINPGDSEQVEQLFADVFTAKNTTCLGAIHLWSLDAPSIGNNDISLLEKAQTLGCGGALRLAQTLANPKISGSPRLWLVTQNAQKTGEDSGEMAVMQSPLWGFGRVLALEHPEIWGGLVDLDSGSSETNTEMLLLEILNPDGEDQIAFRDGKRFAARLRKTDPKHEEPPFHVIPAQAGIQKGERPIDSRLRGNDVERGASRQPGQRLLQIQADGKYIITGGLGALGRRVALWLAEKNASSLVLIGRSGLPERETWDGDSHNAETKKRIAAVRDLEKRGATVQIMQADVGDRNDMARIFKDLQKNDPPIRGVFHAAGVTSFQPVAEMTLDELQTVMKPKVNGAWILHGLTKDLELDFFVNFSSIASVWGSNGQAHYAAANYFLDALADYRASLGLPALSVNWGPWAGGGMVTDEAEAALARMGVEALAARTAVKALETLLAEKVSRKVVAKVDWDAFKPIFEAKARRPLLAEMKIDDEPTNEKSASRQSEFLQKLNQIPPGKRRDFLFEHIENEVRFALDLDVSEELNPNQGFFEMGMDSLMAVELKNRLQAAVGLELPRTLTFEYPNLQTLADFLADEVLIQNLAAKNGFASQMQNMKKTNGALSPTEIAAMPDEKLVAVFEQELAHIDELFGEMQA